MCVIKKAFVYLIIGFIANAFVAYSQMNTCAGMCPINPTPSVSTVTPLNSVIFHLIGIFINMIIAGYSINAISAISKQENNFILPFFNYGNCFLKGFKFNLAIIFTVVIYTILTILFFSLLPNIKSISSIGSNSLLCV